MTKRNYNIGIFNQLEEVITKLDHANDMISNLIKTNELLRNEIKQYQILLDKANKKNKELLIEIERLKNNNNNNSSN